MHEVMRASSPPPPPPLLNLAPPNRFLGGVRHLRVPQVVSGRLSVMYEDRREDSMMNDAGEQPRLQRAKNRVSHRYRDARDRRRGKNR